MQRQVESKKPRQSIFQKLHGRRKFTRKQTTTTAYHGSTVKIRMGGEQ